MPETFDSTANAAFRRTLEAYRVRFRVATTASALLTASAVAGLTIVVLETLQLPALYARLAAVAAFLSTAGLTAVVWWRHWTLENVAALLEKRAGHLENMVVTAAELVARGRTIHRVVQHELLGQALARLSEVLPARVQPLALPVGRAAAAVIVAGSLLVFLPGAQMRIRSDLDASPAGDARRILSAGDLRVTVFSPPHIGGTTATSINPLEVIAVEGSRVRLEMPDEGLDVRLVEPSSPAVGFEATGGVRAHELVAVQSRALLIQQRRNGGQGTDRLVQLKVEPDRSPVVRIRAPGKDLVFAEGKGQVPIEVEASDDFALASLSLRYTRVSGSGETFSFEEGDVPLLIERANDGRWDGQATLSLEPLKLGDGDALVYRAVASDRRPGADPAVSESFLIEIGRIGGVASTGFAVPEDRDRQALSQQMVIIKTERLDAERSKLTPDAVAEQAQMLAVEQRMVRAEFVFMTGGEVADEIAEAEAGHELAEGRFENAAQIELLTAVREMSRAEGRLNAADTTQALVFERAALRALQRAFDRRRYLLRTLPERTRIDPGRRLSGSTAGARLPARAASHPETDPTIARARAVVAALAAALQIPSDMNAQQLAADVLAIDPSAAALQAIASALSSSRDTDERIAAARQAQHALADIVRSKLAPGPRGRVGSDPLGGRVADELTRQGSSR